MLEHCRPEQESLREYVECFTRASIEVHGAQNGLKCSVFESDLREDYKFKKELGLRVDKDMSDLLTHAQPYINYEEKKLAEEALISK